MKIKRYQAFNVLSALNLVELKGLPAESKICLVKNVSTLTTFCKESEGLRDGLKGDETAITTLFNEEVEIEILKLSEEDKKVLIENFAGPLGALSLILETL